jgi:hypothetical protein
MAWSGCTDEERPNEIYPESAHADGRPDAQESQQATTVCTENLKFKQSGDEVRPGWRVN